jgi:hypothetical protein
MPIQKAVASGNGNIEFYVESTVKSPNFVTAHNFVTAAGNVCEVLFGYQL